MDSRGNELSGMTPMAVVKDEPLDNMMVNQDVQNSQQVLQSIVNNNDDTEHRSDCIPESQEHEERAFLNKCVFCDKIFTHGDDPKLLECLHAACTRCIANKISDSNTSVDVDVMRELFFCIKVHRRDAVL